GLVIAASATMQQRSLGSPVVHYRRHQGQAAAVRSGWRRAGRCRAGRPLLLVVDDLHWADRPTIRLLQHVAARSEGAPRMIVATYRDTEMHLLAEELATLCREVAVERIALADGRSPHTPPPSAPTSTSARRRSSSA